jgi:hypothetical protein
MIASAARFFAVTSLVVAASAGCGPGDPFNRQAVSGNVTFKGQPVKYGRIEFVPADGQKTQLSTEIRDGRFAIEKSKGLSPGGYVWRVYAPDPPPDLNAPPPDVPGDVKGPTPKESIPVKYNDQSKERVEVKAGEKNELAITIP